MCLQSRAPGIHPSHPLRLSAHTQRVLTTRRSWENKNSGKLPRPQGAAARGWTETERSFFWQGSSGSRNSPPQETSPLGRFVGRKSPQLHLSSSQLLILSEDAFTSGARDLFSRLFCWIRFVQRSVSDRRDSLPWTLCLSLLRWLMITLWPLEKALLQLSPSSTIANNWRSRSWHFIAACVEEGHHLWIQQ